ncbi:MAG TPA: family 16 glycoside hydrolase [Planctomycetota bacterium]|jgi:putative heme-binding domain-containing protein|nr:family 16 glycoside hydrolase [Planctomycetota bacterium]
MSAPLFGPALAAVAGLSTALAAQEPGGARWIWGSWAEALERPDGERCFFRATFALPGEAREGRAFVASDNHFSLWVNGAFVGRGDSWENATRIDLARSLHPGENVLAVEARNDAGPAALFLFADVVAVGGERFRIESGLHWRTAERAPEGWTSPGFDDRGWSPAREIGRYGEGPWAGVVWESRPRFEPLPGFRVETVAEGIGSLLAIALDGGGLVASVEGGGILRLRDVDRDGTFEEVRTLSEEVRSSHGLLVSDGALFAVGEGSQGSGLYRIEEGKTVLLGRFGGEGGEHGAHGVVEGPDGRLYVAIGNHATLEETWSPASPYRIHYEGHVLPRILDPRGHAHGVKSPSGIVARVDREGREWEVFAGGLRNSYDLAFDGHGDLFALDSDMEWDAGLPWYRPVRLLHVVPGGEYGSRTGSSVWPDSYADSLPAAVEVGRGSPTGMCLYDAGAFPPRLDGALLAGDWSLGRILAFHLSPKGASYGGTVETLLQGRPLNVTDLVVAPDGSLLFATGGRGSLGGVHRLLYEGQVEDASSRLRTRALSPPRFDARAPLPAVLAGLGDPDRFVRFAAARELERRDVGAWEEESTGKGEPLARAEALVALARVGLGLADAPACARGIGMGKDLLGAGGTARLVALRALELLLLDADAPHPADLRGLGESLLRLFPTGDHAADREIAALLARLAPAGTVEALLDRLEGEPSRSEQIHLAYALRTVRKGWGGDAVARFARWLSGALGWEGGFSFEGYVRRIREDFLGLLDGEARKAAEAEAPLSKAHLSVPARAGAEPRDFDRTLLFLQRTLDRPWRSRGEGARNFRERCAACHRFGDDRGGVGPDLTGVAGRFALPELLEEVLAPSRRVADPYRTLEVVTKGGALVAGMPLLDDGSRLSLLRSDGETVELGADEIAERRPSARSAMPEGLVDPLTLEEVSDLFAYLLEADSVPPAPGPLWTPLFDGRTLAGWRGDPSLWRVEGGTIVGESEGLPESRFLVSRGDFADFLIEAEVRVSLGNSGLQFRSGEVGPSRLRGYQADLGESNWGSLYEEGGRGTLAQVPFDVWRSIVEEKGWNHLLVGAVGDRIRIEMNGVPTVELRDAAAERGRFGIQLHAGGRTRVFVRNLRLRTAELSRSGG